MDQSENPFASPHADLSSAPLDDLDLSNTESIRRHYLKHEASVKSIGLLYYFSAFFPILGSVVLLIATIAGQALMKGTDEAQADELMISIAILVGLLISGLIMFYVGKGLRALNPKIKIPVGIFSAIGLLSFPFGTIINGCILYLVFGKKGKTVFSEQYREVVRQTPHIKYKTSRIVIVFAVILGVVICAGIIGFVLLG